jgi:aspartate/tyrosine/aromatic aminotransferase
MMDNNMDKEYAGITGVPAFTKAAGELAYGDAGNIIADKKVRCIYFFFSVATKETEWILNILFNV